MPGELADALIARAVLSAPGGLRRYTPGSLLVAIDTDTLAELQAVAIGQALLSAGVGAPPVFGLVDLTQHVQGILPVARGGLGVGTLAAGAVLLGNATGVVQTVAPGASGHLLTSNGAAWASAAPATPTSIVSASAAIATSEGTSSTTYADLATVGPQVTIVVGASGILMVGVSAYSSGTYASYTDFALSGANTRAAQDVTALRFEQGVDHRSTAVTMLSGLTPGSTTILQKYRVNAGNKSLSARSLWALTW